MAISLDFHSHRVWFLWDSGMETTDLFRSRIAAMINLRHPLDVPATRMPWNAIETTLAPKFKRKDRPGDAIEREDMLGPKREVLGAGRSDGGRPETLIRLLASLVCLKHSFNPSDEDARERWNESPLWQFFSC